MDVGDPKLLKFEILFGTAKWEAYVGMSRKADEVLIFLCVFISSIIFDPFIVNC